jgi:nucleoside-diphosphate-sugar epimerase
MPILVTGGAGFLGRYVMTRLRNDATDAVSVDIDVNKGGEYLDVRDFARVNSKFADLRPDVVIHLAALAGASGKGGAAESPKDPFNYLNTNFVGTLNVFEACRLNDVKRVIHMSSCSVYGRTTERITELTPVNPDTPYGFSKASAELVAKCYASNYGIRTLIFRSSLICGEGQREMNALREFVMCAKNGMPLLVFGEGEHVREWLHPIDVADAMTRGLSYFNEMTNPYEIFVLGSKPVSMKDLARLVVSKTNRGNVVHLHGGRRTFDQCTNPEKIARLLGWTASIPVEDIVSRVAMQDFFLD